MLQLNFTNIFWILVASISGALAPIIVKYYIKSNNVYLPILAWFVSGISIISFIFVFKSGDAISKSYPIIKGLTILFVILMGVFLFNEKLKIGILSVSWIFSKSVVSGILLHPKYLISTIVMWALYFVSYKLLMDSIYIDKVQFIYLIIEYSPFSKEQTSGATQVSPAQIQSFGIYLL